MKFTFKQKFSQKPITCLKITMEFYMQDKTMSTADGSHDSRQRFLF